MFTRYLRIPHMYSATPTVLVGVGGGGGAAGIVAHMFCHVEGLHSRGGTDGRGGSLKRTPMYFFSYSLLF